MPYPLAKLPYDFRRRLHFLGAPVDRYNLQIAAGNMEICPPRLQLIEPSKNILYFSFGRDGLQILEHELPSTTYEFTVEDNDLVVCTKILHIYEASLQSLSSDIVINHFILKPSYLFLIECDTSPEFYETLSKRIAPDNVGFVLFHPRTPALPSDYDALLEKFPNVRRMALMNFSKNWIDLIKAYDFTSLFLKGTVDEIGEIPADELIELVMARPYHSFRLALVVETTEKSDSYVATLHETFKHKMEVCNGYAVLNVRNIMVQYGDVVTTYCDKA